MSTQYPGTIQTFTDPAGTSQLATVDHAALHTNMNDTVEAIQDTIGTTAGTSVLKNFAQGDFAVRINSSNVPQQPFNSGTLGTPSLTGGTVSGQVVNSGTISGGVYGTATVTGGTINNAVVGTPIITGGTATSPTINNPTLNANASHGTAVFAVDVTAETVLTIANDATAQPFGASNNFSGMILITNITSGVTAAFLIGGAATAVIGQSNGSSEFSITSGSASKTNIYQSAAIVTIQNKMGSQQTYRVMAFRTRPQL
jgi:hypothetical protein